MSELVNVLEEQVIKEAERQISALPLTVQRRVRVTDVAAYVLNRMPPMYATNQDGWAFQREKALRRVSREITQRVFEAIDVMKKSPARSSRPLPKTVSAESALNQVRTILEQPDLDWLTLPQMVRQLRDAARISEPGSNFDEGRYSR
ncbi:MAG: late competence development ComFB family protein [Cyanobacteria bacterium P01_D01_bin.123]